MTNHPYIINTINTFLERYQRFGVHLGLERINQLLANLGNPHHQVPIIHVAGTNGKGSVCAYLSSVLTAAGYRVGRYTSPHLVDWTERICLNQKPILASDLINILQQVEAAISPDEPSPTQFEVITAAAWLYFAQQQVDIAVIEVGLGGRLDATNVCDHPLVTVITSISLEHWQRLGPTVADIAGEKAGILKPGCPAMIGQLPDSAKAVVKQRIEALNCPVTWVKPATIKSQDQTLTTAIYQGIEYPLSLQGNIQQSNSAIAIATLKNIQQQGWQISADAIWQGMKNTEWLGRIQWTQWRNNQLLIDGAHNPAAAAVLRQYIDTIPHQSVSWVMGMLSTKDHVDIFQALLQPGDHLYLVPVPDHSSAKPKNLAKLALQICPELAQVKCYPDLKDALDIAFSGEHELTVLCGSLYLLGYFFTIE
ncbi:MAG: folylpolyglutamate synthase/dihydrofolate synthase family protein [Microcoleaceae cyanobacterium]